MSNVKTGDIAWWITLNPHPVCQVGIIAAPNTHVHIYTPELGRLCADTSSRLSWWCKFDRPVYMVLAEDVFTGRQLKVTCEYFPIEDQHLRKICDGNFQLPADDLKLFLPEKMKDEIICQVNINNGN